MNLIQLRYLAAVVEVGSVTRAATILGVSAPTVSKALQRLEQDVGEPLLVPDGRGVAATSTARDLARRADRVLTEWQALERSLDEHREVRTTLRIASFETFTTYFLGALVDAELADRDVSIVSAVPGAVEIAVADATADIGFTYVAVPTSGVQHLPIGSVEMAVAVRAGGVRESEPIASVPFAVPAGGVASSIVRQRSADGWPDGIERVVRYRVNAMETALELCRRDLAAAYVPKFVVDLHNRTAAPEKQLAVRAAEVDRSIEAHLAYRTDEAHLDDVHRIASAAASLVAARVAG